MAEIAGSSKKKLSFTTERDNQSAPREFYDDNIAGSIVDDDGFILARIWADYPGGKEITQALVDAYNARSTHEPRAESDRAGDWYLAEDIDRLVRELDVLLNGEEGAAKQAKLCDIVAQVRRTQPPAPEPGGEYEEEIAAAREALAEFNSESLAVMARRAAEEIERMKKGMAHLNAALYAADKEITGLRERSVYAIAERAAQPPGLNRERAIALLVEAEGLLCDPQGGWTANELAGRIRSALTKQSESPPEREWLSKAVDDAMAQANREYLGTSETNSSQCLHDLQRPDKTVRMHQQDGLVGWKCYECGDVWMPASRPTKGDSQNG